VAKKGIFCGIFKRNYGTKKAHYATNYAIYLKLRGGKPFFAVQQAIGA